MNPSRSNIWALSISTLSCLLALAPLARAQSAALANTAPARTAATNGASALPAASIAPAAQVAPVAPAVSPAEGPQSLLTIHINDLNLPGWQPQPFYMWNRLTATPPAPAAGEAAKTSPSATATTSATAAMQAASAGPHQDAGAQSFRTVSPRLPEADTNRETILGEYKLNGFFRKAFQRGQRTIYIDAFDFQTVDGAYGAYNYLRRGATTVMPRGDAASEDNDSISLVQGKTFLSVYGTSEDDDEAKEAMQKVAGEAVKYIADKGLQPAALYRLPRLELVRGSEKIVMGPLSVRRFFPAPYLTALGLENGTVVGCVGDYQIQEPAKERLKLMILTYRSAAEAAAARQNFLTQLAEGHGSDPSTMMAQTINVVKVSSTFLAVEQRGADILMVIGARKRFSPALVLRQVR
ncbi:MAG: hypothetical protein KGS72_00965 [Cyanobacteria bacterium REEB67]|nr:hypothetical protein [Cyanobacteria bacterium REEB67]